jgi:2-dehydropantoate 2-reductase
LLWLDRVSPYQSVAHEVNGGATLCGAEIVRLSYEMKIAVVGTGAIGSFYDGKLAHGGRDVHFLVRSGFAKIKRSGIRIRGRKANFHTARVQAYETVDAIGPCDLVMIALKATNNEALLQLIPPLLHPRTVLLTLQKGLGNEDFVARYFGANRVMGGPCFICLNRISPCLIEHLDYVYLTIGEFTGHSKPRTRAVVREFQENGVACRMVDNLMQERWGKLVWNIPFNGLTIAAGGITTEDILQDDSLHSAALALMNEVIEGAKGCGYNLPADIAVEHMKRTETMGPYEPSTLLDFEAGRTLEIEAIWGEPLCRARTGGTAMPRLEQLYALLKSLNARRE